MRTGGGQFENAAKAHRTVSRVTAILELVAAAPAGVRLRDLAEALEAPKSSVFGLAKGLVSTGYLVEIDGAYRLGPALGSLIAVERPGLVDAARPALDALRDRVDETVTLATPAGNSLVYVASAESRQPIRFSPELRVRRPLYPPSTGKVLIAFWPDSRRDALLANVVPAERLDQVRAELELVRETGVAFNPGETRPDLSGVARAVRKHGQILGAVSVAGPSGRVTPRLDEIAEALADAIADIEHSL